MNYTKILWSLGTIAVVGALAVGVTGAFFTDTAESQGNTFNSGTLDLLINPDAIGGSGFQNSFAQGDTPGYGALNPGGDEADLSARLRNTGSADSEAIGLAVNHTTNENGIAAQMRITQLDWKGENLLEGGAGANLSDYTPPTSCDVTVSSGDSIQTDGIDNANSGETVCVETGTYDELVRFQDDNVTLAATGDAVIDPDQSTVDAASRNRIVDTNQATGVTLSGFTIIGPDNSNSGPVGVTVWGDDSTIEYIEVENVRTGIQTSGGAAANTTIDNVSTSDSQVGISIQSSNTTLSNFDVENASFEGLGIVDDQSGIEITNGNFIGLSGPHLRVYDVGGSGSVDIHTSNLTGGADGIENNSSSITVDATNNWWGDFDPSDQVTGDVDYDPIAGGPHVGLVGGTDFNSNGFADLQDLAQNPITNATPGLDAGETGQLNFTVQLDGPTTDNSFQDSDLTSDFTFTLGQVTN